MPTPIKVKMPIGMRRSYWFPVVTMPANAHPVYGDKVDMGAARKGYLTVTTANVEIPGDDILQEYAEWFASGQLDVETDCSDLELNATVYGHSYANSAETSNINDTAPHGAYAFIEPLLLKGGAKVFRATFIYNVKAMQSSEKTEADTKTPGSLDPKVNAVSFKVMADNTGDWRKRAEFANQDDAEAWIDSMAGSTAAYAVEIQHVGAGTSNPGAGITYVTAGQNLVIDFGSSDPAALYDGSTEVTSSITAHKYTLSAVAAPHKIIAIWAV